jgi:hypothetical protein
MSNYSFYKLSFYYLFFVSIVSCNSIEKQGESVLNPDENIDTTSINIDNIPQNNPVELFEKNNYITLISNIDKLREKGLLGTYWNDPYVRVGGINESDIFFNLVLKKGKLELQFQYYDEDPAGRDYVARDGGQSKLTQISETTFSFSQNDIYCLNEGYKYFEQLCFVEKEGQKGISFDGETIDFYRRKNILTSFEPEFLMEFFYDNYDIDKESLIATNSNAEGNTIKFIDIQSFEQDDKEYALVFFEEIFDNVQGAAEGPNSKFLNIAKFEKVPRGMLFIEYVYASPFGDYDNNNIDINYPIIQEIGNKVFLLKKENGEIIIYDTKRFKKVFSTNLEVGKSLTYTKKEENDCAIIVKNNILGNANIDLEIFFFDEEENTFIKEEKE